MRPEEQDASETAAVWRSVLAEVLEEYRAVTGEAPPVRSKRPPANPAAAAAWARTGYVDGPTLPAVVGATGPLPAPAVAALAIGIAESLAQIHAVGVVRGDLKPVNILLGEDGPGLRVVEFGVAGAADGSAVAEAGWAFDDPGYLAPEQVLGLPIGPAADVFSLGGVLYYAACGMLPFGGGESSSVVFRVVHEEPELDSVPVVVRGLVKACLSKDPAQRPVLMTVIDRAIGVLADAVTAQAVDGAVEETVVPEAFPDDLYPESVFPDVAMADAVSATALMDPALKDPEPTNPGLMDAAFVSLGDETPRELYLETVSSSSVFAETGFTEAALAEAGFTDTGFDDTAFAESGFTASAFERAAFPDSVFADPTRTMAMPAVDPEPTTVIAPPQAPPPKSSRRSRSSSRRHGRSRTVSVVTLGTVVVVGIAAAFLVRSAAKTTPAAARPSASPTLTGAPLPGTFLAGPGCPASPWASITQSVADNAGLEPDIGGGPPGCAGQAIAFVKSGRLTPGPSSFTWTFRVGWSSHCTLAVYIANADPSSGVAQYQLYVPASRTATGVAARFQINQGKAKGQWVAVPALTDVALPDGAVQLTLTDAGSFAGDHFHVTASAVRATCNQVP